MKPLEPDPYDNPYAAPDAEVETYRRPQRGGYEPARVYLAERATRLGARILDWITQVIALVPGFGVLFHLANQRQGRPPSDQDVAIFMGVCALGLLILLGVNCYLLALSGQTLGKRALGIKIVLQDGSPAGLGRLFGLRIFVVGILESLPFGIGLLVGLVNVLMIFGEDRRCLHDHVAGTIVVRA